MIKIKWGQCIDCEPKEEDKPLTAKRCPYHHKLTKKKPVAIKLKSSKQNARDRKYKVIRDKWIVEHSICEMMITSECQYNATDVHHSKGKIGNLYFDTKWFKAGCRICHNYVETHVEEAIQKGLTFSRTADE